MFVISCVYDDVLLAADNLKYFIGFVRNNPLASHDKDQSHISNDIDNFLFLETDIYNFIYIYNMKWGIGSL